MAFEQSSIRRYGRFYRNARKYASRREVLISTYLILSLFTVSFFAAVFIRPTAVKIARLWREIQDKRTVQTQLEKKIRDLEKAQTLYTSIEDELYLLERALPTEPHFNRFVQKIEYLSSIHEVRLHSGHYSSVELYRQEPATASSSELVAYPFDITLQGSFSGLKEFAQDLQSLDRMISLTSISMSPVASQEQEGIYELSATIESLMYAFPEGLEY